MGGNIPKRVLTALCDAPRGFLEHMASSPPQQIDLFIASATDVSPKEQQDLMARCWFNLAKRKRVSPIEHHFGDSWVKITANEKYGMATIFDNDLIIFAVAQLMHNLNHGMAVGRTLQFTGYEYYKFLGKKRLSGTGYRDLWSSMERLHHTFVETNIRQGKQRTHHSFNWLSSIKQRIDGDTHRGYEITLPDWLYRSVVEDNLILTLDEGYFNIRGGLERWLYLFARKTSGYNSGGWSEGLESIYKKSGSMGSFSEFKRKVKNIVKKQSILGYKLEPVDYRYQSGLYFLRDNELVKLNSEKRQRRGATKWRNDQASEHDTKQPIIDALSKHLDEMREEEKKNGERRLKPTNKRTRRT